MIAGSTCVNFGVVLAGDPDIAVGAFVEEEAGRAEEEGHDALDGSVSVTIDGWVIGILIVTISVGAGVIEGDEEIVLSDELVHVEAGSLVSSEVIVP